MKLCLLFLCVISYAAAELKVKEPSAITYAWLAESPDSDANEYVPYFKEIFEQSKGKTMLQLGVGYSTKYFLENCKRVVSVDFITQGCGPGRFREFLGFYKNFSNWISIAYFSSFQGDTSWAFFKYLGSEHVFKASNYQSTQFKSYAALDMSYLKELGSFLNNLVKLNHFEVAFIDPLLFIRGDLVQLLLGKIPVILAYDASSRISGAFRDVYGYAQVTVPADYEEIHLRGIHGTVAWIQKNGKYDALIEALKKKA